ncbi:hypothetical protein Stsp02_22460 [Streptomyces sp. NBRC 14336]|uniref:hypothetical protein n=1 Tax=Streptomyces sp. NBRC 14336 TaxID=3030992 RepID=UPI00249FA97C|nr:hypothetical protein [Streptomyces sp. NBRC 14336]GLW46584.1 hypothetical protein Stsp02_22460 [Streptomyces sp. NBRC 14336]
MIEKLWLYPPLAFARLGPSPEPCENYRYGPNDLTARGTGKTVAQPAPSLVVAEDGTLTERPPRGNRVRFKDERGFRPICPFFEVHGTWVVDGERDNGPITRQVLDAFGLTLADVEWKVEVANLKAHHCTRSDDDRIDATVEIPGNEHRRRPLEGRSPQGAARPLVPPGRHIPLGSVHIPRPSDDFPELRLRFTPAAGLVYGPTDLLERTDRYPLPAERLFLSPESRWCEFRAVGFDPRTAPAGLYAGASDQDGGTCFGLVDDVCDGLVGVTIGDLTARARVVVTPPDFAPDRRPFTSLADGLADRVKRAEVRDPAYISANPQLTALEVRDLFERALEAMESVNVDAQNQRATGENIANAQAEGSPVAEARARTFPPPVPLAGITLPLTERGRRKHRRFLALEVLEDLIREQPDFIQRFVRPPGLEEAWYDRRMPVANRGSDAFPMHVTRRQYDLLTAWAASVRAGVEEGS